MRSTRLIVDLNKIRSNIIELKKTLKPDAKVMAIVKANAYGHGVLGVAHNVIKNGYADWFGVATPEEGRYLVDNGVNVPILILGPANDEEYEMCIKGKYSLLRQTVFDKNQVLKLNDIAEKYGEKVYVHIKINSGMNRIGLKNKDAFVELLETVKACKNVVAEGIFTHFATADEADNSATLEQIRRFEEMLDVAKSLSVTFDIVHGCNTAGTMCGYSEQFNLFRLGIGIYGYYPSEYVRKTTDYKLLPAAEYITKISAINEIDKGDAVSYGGTFVADKKMTIATLPVGYADGYSRRMSNKGKVIINGRFADIIGKICMDQMMVDISGIPNVKIGDEAVLIGKRGDVSIDADDLAELCDTISYEILTSFSQRVERVYINE